jgi:hypothetical protein
MRCSEPGADGWLGSGCGVKMLLCVQWVVGSPPSACGAPGAIGR